ncbi:MAG: putative Penicillinase repressor, transcriptional regulatory protein [Rhodospirillales bacterium]|jgi:BlaI family penicillinase repressor|nr:putative Penicillinase repressor, transcriptional regulatory protein [Rhodospirillales bacterium]
MQDDLDALSELERDVMQLVWAQDAITADEVRVQLDRELKDSTIRTVLRRLEEKGYVGHEIDGRTYRYRATHAREHVAARAVHKIVHWLGGGSVEDVLVGMVDAKLLDRAQLQRIAEKLAKAKKGGGK